MRRAGRLRRGYCQDLQISVPVVIIRDEQLESVTYLAEIAWDEKTIAVRDVPTELSFPLLYSEFYPGRMDEKKRERNALVFALHILRSVRYLL